MKVKNFFVSSILYRFCFVILLSSCFVFSGFAQIVHAKALLKEINHSKLSAQAELLTLSLQGDCELKSFTIKEGNPRIVFDLHGAQRASSVASSTPVDGIFIKKIRLGIHDNPNPKIRIVLDMKTLQGVQYDHHFDKQSGTLLIDIYKGEKPKNQTTASAEDYPETAPQPLVTSNPPAEDNVKQAAKKVEPQEQPKVTETAIKSSASSQNRPILEKVTFQKSPEKGEMIMFKLNGFYPPRVHGVEEGPPKAICDFDHTVKGAEAKDLVGMDGEYVQSIHLSNTKGTDGIQAAIELEPNKNYDIQQVFFKEDNLFVIIVNPIETE